MPAAVVLLSGGLDSYTAAAVARRDGFDLHALSIRYGQRHAQELQAARRVAAALGVRQHLEIDVDLSRMGGSALTADIAVPKDAPIDPAVIPVTYVPARNTVFLSLALGWAEVVGAARPRHRRECPRLLRLSGLPARVHPRLRGTRAGCDQGGRRGTGVHRACAAHRAVEGRDRTPGRVARTRLRPHPQLLRPAARWPPLPPLRQLPAARRRLCARPALPDPLVPIP